MANAKKGMGFKAAVANAMRKGGYSKDAASAIIANAARKASPAAKAKNPNLLKVSGSGSKKAKGKSGAGKKAAKKRAAKK